MKKQNVLVICLIITLVSIRSLDYIYKDNNPKIEILENTLIIEDEDREYLLNNGYGQSALFDNYYRNDSKNTGISLTSDSIEIDKDSGISGYSLDLSYETNIEHERVMVELEKEGQDAGTIIIDDLGNIRTPIVNIDDDKYKEEIASFIEFSHDFIDNLTGEYEFDKGWGEHVITYINFSDHINLNKNKNGYELCNIEYFEDSCYSKSNYVYKKGGNYTSIILSDNDYQLGYRKTKIQKYLQDKQKIEETIELRYGHDRTIETYTFDNIKPKYHDLLKEQYSDLKAEYKNFEVDLPTLN